MSTTDAELTLPGHWRHLDADELGDFGDRVYAGFANDEGSARILVNRDPPLGEPLEAAAAALRERLSTAIHDYQHISDRQIELQPGPALTTTYVRMHGGTVESVTIVPLEDCTYSLIGTVVAGHDDDAVEVAEIVASFTTLP